MTEPVYNLHLSPRAADVPQGGVFVLGNFDGVHRGHQSVIKAAIDQGRRLGGVPVRVLTLEPHPRALFKPDHPPFRLTPPAVKLRLLREQGVDDVIVINFSEEFSRLPANEFVEQILIKRHAAKHVVAGFDFVFGYQRGGNMTSLRALLSPHGVGVTEVAPFRDSQGEMMSSSRTREALQQGDMTTAQHILGRPWSISGSVQSGAQRGHAMGFPTANIGLREYLRPKFGVYAISARAEGNPHIFTGVANIGTRPTVDGAGEMLEFHLFDFYTNIYGQEWTVELLQFIRPEIKFPDLAALQAQILKDVETAKLIHAKPLVNA